MKPYPVILMVAKRNSGKSCLIKDIMSYRRHLTAGVVMSGSERANGFYSAWVPPIFIYNEFDREALLRLLRRQERLLKEGKAQPVFVIFDDLGFDKKMFNDKVVRELFMNGRHFMITTILSLQYCIDLAPAMRSNVDYVFSLKENLYREKLFKNFFPIVGNLATFSALMDELTQDYGALVFDNTKNSSKISDCVFHYKARLDRKPFKLGSPEAWSFSKTRVKNEDDDNLGESCKKKTILVVKKVKG